MIRNKYHKHSKSAGKKQNTLKPCHYVDPCINNEWLSAYKIIYNITQRDLCIIELWQKLIYDKLNNPIELENLRVSEIAVVMRECTSRYSLLWEKPKNGDYLFDGRDISELSEDELLKIIKKR